MQKTLKMTKMSTSWRHYDVKTTRDKIFNTIFRILIQFTLRLVMKIFFYRMIFRVKICKRKKSSDFAYFYHISLYKIDPRAEFHKIRYLDPILPGNAFNIWFFWLSMTPCNFLWGSLDGPPPPQNFAPNKTLRTRLSWIWPDILIYHEIINFI